MNKTPLILIVDDDPLIQRASARMLKQAGYRTIQASDGLTGLQMAREQKPNLTLLDVNLPDISGLEVCRLIKTDPALAMCFVVLLSNAHIDTQSQVDGLEGGADGYIPRPVTNAELLARVRGVLRIQQAEAARSEAQQLYESIFRLSPEAILVTTEAEGRYLAVNDSHEHITGYRADEVIGHTVGEFAAWDSPFDRQVVIQRLREQGGVAKMEVRFHRKSGEPYFAVLSMARLEVAGEKCIVSILTDITERKQAEDVLRESEARYRLIAENTADVVWTVSLATGKFTYVSPSVQKMHGYTPQEVLNQTMTDALTPEAAAKATTLIQQQISAYYAGNASTMVSTYQIDQIRKDGTAVPTEVVATFIANEQGQLVEIVGVSRDITERNQRENELQIISGLSAALRTAPNRARMLPVIIEQLSKMLHCDAILAEMIDPLTREAVVEAASGAWSAFIGHRQPAGTGWHAVIAETRKPYRGDRIKDDPRFEIPNYLTGHKLIGAGMPLIAQDQLIGFLWLERKKDLDEFEFRLLAAIADMAANALYRTTLHEQSQKNAADLVLAYDSTLEGWAHALELRDQETEGHTRRVMQMAVELACAMGIVKAELENIRRGALLHDIGKMGIPDSILLKPGTLNEQEWEIMRRHPEYAYQFLEPIDYLHPVLDIPYCHHEKWDGSGYPRGLKGEEIPLVARIFAIVDVWDALRSDRPYRPAWTSEKTRNYIIGQSGVHFNPQVVQTFLEMIESNG